MTDFPGSDRRIARLPLALATLCAWLSGTPAEAPITALRAQEPAESAPAKPEKRQPNNSPYLARFTLAGEPAVVTRVEAARDVALRYRRGNEGKNITGALIDAYLVRTEAIKLRVWPGASTVEA
ncbi:MAG: hypothetical protein AAFP86_24440, partial [Planctomycetota bacterium]